MGWEYKIFGWQPDSKSSLIHWIILQIGQDVELRTLSQRAVQKAKLSQLSS